MKDLIDQMKALKGTFVNLELEDQLKNTMTILSKQSKLYFDSISDFFPNFYLIFTLLYLSTYLAI